MHHPEITIVIEKVLSWTFPVGSLVTCRRDPPADVKVTDPTGIVER